MMVTKLSNVAVGLDFERAVRSEFQPVEATPETIDARITEVHR
jgi:hypothetical protein